MPPGPRRDPSSAFRAVQGVFSCSLAGFLAGVPVLLRVDKVPVEDLTEDVLLLRHIPQAPLPGARVTVLNRIYVVRQHLRAFHGPLAPNGHLLLGQPEAPPPLGPRATVLSPKNAFLETNTSL